MRDMEQDPEKHDDKTQTKALETETDRNHDAISDGMNRMQRLS